MKKILLITIITVLTFSFVGCGAKEEKEAAEVAYVKLEEPSSKDFSDKLSLPATLKAKNEASVNSNVASMVTAVNVGVGDQVTKGQTLAVLDSAMVSKTYEKAKIGFQTAEKNYFRIKNLYNEGAISLMDCEAAKASYDLAMEDYNLAKLNYDYTRMTAPMTGIVSVKNLEVGQMAAPGQEAFRIVDLSSIIAESGVSEKDITKLAYGQNVNISLESGKKYVGKIDSISPVTDSMTGTYPVSVSIDNTDGSLKSGMFADIEIIFGVNKNGIAIKNTSIINEDDVYYVFVARDGKAEKKKIEIGIQDEEYTEIVKGITLEDKVICSGQDALKDGDKIKIIKES